jgi:hypothetical protein
MVSNKSTPTWISKWDAMDIGRRLRPELSDEELRLRLDAAAGPPPEPPETLLETLHLHSVKYAPTSPTVTDPTQKIRVRQRWQNFSKTPEYFDPDVERLFSIDNEAEAEPPAAAPVADTTSAAAAITAVEPPEATADMAYR